MPLTQHALVLGTQAGGGGDLDEEEGEGEVVEEMGVVEFDERWLREQPAEHRAVRRSAVAALLPALERAWLDRVAGGGKKNKKSAAAAGAATIAATRQRGGGGGVGKGRSGRGKGSPAVGTDEQQRPQQQEQQQQKALNQFLVQRRARALLEPPAAAARAAAAVAAASKTGSGRAPSKPPVRRGLVGAEPGGTVRSSGGGKRSGRGGGKGSAAPGDGGLGLPTTSSSSPGALMAWLQRELSPLPPAPAPMAGAAITAAAAGPPLGASFEIGLSGANSPRGARDRPEQQQTQAAEAAGGRCTGEPSPSKNARSTPGSVSDDLEVVLSSPDSPRMLPLAERLRRQQQQGLHQHEQQERGQPKGIGDAAAAMDPEVGGGLLLSSSLRRRSLHYQQEPREPGWGGAGGAAGKTSRQEAEEVEVVNLVTPPTPAALPMPPDLGRGGLRVALPQREEEDVVDLTLASP